MRVLIDTFIWIDYFKSGNNGIGIPDLLIAQNSKQQNCKIYSLDKHFRLLNETIEDIQLFT